MIGSIERLWQLARRSSVLAATPIMLVVTIPSAHDSMWRDPMSRDPMSRDPITKRGAATTGGVLPIPSAATTGARRVHLDSLLAGRREPRTERGRVLYAPGHAPRDRRDTAATPRPMHKPCPTQRVIAQAHASSGPAT